MVLLHELYTNYVIFQTHVFGACHLNQVLLPLHQLSQHTNLQYFSILDVQMLFVCSKNQNMSKELLLYFLLNIQPTAGIEPALRMVQTASTVRVFVRLQLQGSDNHKTAFLNHIQLKIIVLLLQLFDAERFCYNSSFV